MNEHSFKDFSRKFINKGLFGFDDPAFQMIKVVLPNDLKGLIGSIGSGYKIEGSAGKGTWSRTPWIAIMDHRITDRASEGFYVAIVFSEDMESFVLCMMNSATLHIHKDSRHLDTNTLGNYSREFNLGRAPKYSISQSGRGMGPRFEESCILWKKFSIAQLSFEEFRRCLVELLVCYKTASDKYLNAQSKPQT